MTDNWTPTAVVKAFRSVCALLDTGIYALLGFMYEIFFNVATADILSNETILSFYKRVQLIIGVYMVFNFAIIIMKGIVSPDTVTDNKSGMGGFIKRIILALTMLTVLTPISIPSASNEFEKQLNNNGLLFGTLYSLQYRMLNNNTLGRLILGTNDTSSSSSSSSGSGLSGATTQAETLQKSANIFTATILKGFVRINLVPEDQRKDPGDGKSDETLNENRMCQDIDDDTLAIYTATDASPGDILSLINATCTPDSNALTGAIYTALTFFGLSHKTKFAFSYMPIISGAIGIVFIFIFISFTVDVAVRAIKLAVLRLLAPVPVIQYMDPSGKGDNAFNGWVKTVSQTYLDLFIRLASVYFVIFIIQDICTNGIAMNVTGNAVGVISFIFICIGLFAFAKQAPKFIQDLLGLKNAPTGSFGRAFQTMAAGAGMIGSARTGWRAAGIENKAFEADGEHHNPFYNRGRQVLAALGGMAGGAYAGGKAMSGKDASVKSVLAAQKQRNTMRASHSTLPGRVNDQLYEMVNGRSLADVSKMQADGAAAAKKSISTFKDNVLKEALKNQNVQGRVMYTDSAGNTSERRVNVQKLKAAMSASSPTSSTFRYDGQDYEKSQLTTQWFDDAEKAQAIEFQRTGDYATMIAAGGKLKADYDNMTRAVEDLGDNDIQVADLTAQTDWDSTAQKYKSDKGYGSFGPKIGELGRKVEAQNSMRNKMKQANNQNKK